MVGRIIVNVIMWIIVGVMIDGAFQAETPLGRVICIIFAIAAAICSIVNIKDWILD